MPNFLDPYAGNTAQQFGRWFVDRILPGNQRAADGTLNNGAVWGGLGTRAASLAGGFFGGPLVAQGVNRLGSAAINGYYGDGSGIGASPADYANNAPAGYGGNSTNYTDYTGYGFGGGGFDSGAAGVGTGYATIPYYGGQYDPNGIGGIQREQFSPNTQTQAPAINYAMPNYIPTMPQVIAQGQDGGPIGGFANGIFNGGAGNFGNSAPPTAAQLAFGGRSQGGIGGATQGSQWTGISGDAARSYFGGMSTGATDALQHEAMMAMKLQAQ